MTKKIYELHAEICQILANPKRLEILDLLKNGEMSVGDLAKEMGIAIPNLSQHLSLLRQRGVVETRRKGQTIFYRIKNPKIIQACGIMRDVLLEQLAEGQRLIKSLGKKG